MFEDTISVVSIWAAMNSWLTPTVLFVVLNIMIGTIAVTSGLGTGGPKQQQQHPQDQDPAATATGQQQQQQHHQQQQEQHHHQYLSPLGQLTRSPSIVLQRLRSIKLYRSEKEQQQQQTNQVLLSPTTTLAAAASDDETTVTLPLPLPPPLVLQSPVRPDVADPVDFLVRRRFDTEAEKENVVKDTVRPPPSEPLIISTQKNPQQVIQQNGGEAAAAATKGEIQSQKSLDEIFSQIQVTDPRNNNNTFTRSKSDKKPGVAESSAAMLAEKKPGVSKRRVVKKSVSDKATFSHFKVSLPPPAVEMEEEDIVVRKRVGTTTTPADEEVDAKADDFINRFREQLKLQRMESLMAGDGSPGGVAGN